MKLLATIVTIIFLVHDCYAQQVILGFRTGVDDWKALKYKNNLIAKSGDGQGYTWNKELYGRFDIKSLSIELGISNSFRKMRPYGRWWMNSHPQYDSSYFQYSRTYTNIQIAAQYKTTLISNKDIGNRGKLCNYIGLLLSRATITLRGTTYFINTYDNTAPIDTVYGKGSHSYLNIGIANTISYNITNRLNLNTTVSAATNLKDFFYEHGYTPSDFYIRYSFGVGYILN